MKTLLEINVAAKKQFPWKEISDPATVLAAHDEGNYIGLFVKKDGMDELVGELAATRTYELAHIKKHMINGYFWAANTQKRPIVWKSVIMKSGNTKFFMNVIRHSRKLVDDYLTANAEMVFDQLGDGWMTYGWKLVDNDVIIG